MSLGPILGPCRCQGCGETVTYARYVIPCWRRNCRQLDAHVSLSPAWIAATGEPHVCPAGQRPSRHYSWTLLDAPAFLCAVGIGDFPCAGVTELDRPGGAGLQVEVA